MTPTLTLDLVIATFNRAERLEIALRSVMDATLPERLGIRVVVVDNNSTDNTQSVVRALMAAFPLELVLLAEPRQGKSFALNTAISASSADVIGMIDDDERMDSSWFEVVSEWFHRDEGIDFIGGPCKGDWGVPKPSWLPPGASGVLGEVEISSTVQRFGGDFEGMLMGGNAAIRRARLMEVGPYKTTLGRPGGTLISGEDADMYQRLLEAGCTGYYVPEMIIYHWIPPERVTKRYFRRWTYWNYFGLGQQSLLHVEGARYIFGVPRFMWSDVVRGCLRDLWRLITLRWREISAFETELSFRALAGYVVGSWSKEEDPAGPPSG